MKTKWKVVHSVSKDAWNVVNTELGGKYKIARVPYVVSEDNDEWDLKRKIQAENIAQLISKAPEMREMLKEVKCSILIAGDMELYREVEELIESTKL